MTPEVETTTPTATQQASIRERLEQALRASEERFRLFLQHAPAAIAMFDRQMCYLLASRRWIEDYKLGDAELVGRSIYEVFPDMPEHWKVMHRRGLAGEVLHGVEDYLLRANGRVDWIRWEIHPWRNANQEVGGIILFTEVVTAQREAEAALRESKALYQAIFDNSPFAIALTRVADAVQVAANDEFLRLFELTREELVNKTFAELGISTPNELAYLHNLLQKRGAVHEFQCIRTTKTGATQVLSFNLDLVSIGDMPHTLTTVRDITVETLGERERLAESSRRYVAERALNESEARFRSLVNSAVDGIITIGSEGRIESLNPAAERMFSLPAQGLLGKPLALLIPPELNHEHGVYVQRDLDHDDSEARDMGHELVARKGTGMPFPVHMTVTRLSVDGRRVLAVFVRDLTHSKALEDQLRHSQKLEAIGTLTSGVAHDFGNLLMGVLGCATLALRSLPADSPAAHYIQELSEAAKRGTGLTKQLLSFSRKQQVDLKPLDFGRVLRAMEGLLRMLAGDRVELLLMPVTGSRYALGDAGQLEQILVNLVLNARDAMVDGGCIAIRLEETNLASEVTERSGLASAKSFLKLSVSDDGPGMDAATSQRVFEPFFTTKEQGKGTGLGLSTVYGIVKQFGGSIHLHSALGYGTTFELLFPCLSEPAPAPDLELAPLPRGAEVVLLVDDEPLVSLTVRHYLETLGYEVVTASDPDDALRVLQGNPSKGFALLLTDVVMPRGGGRLLAERVRALRPAIRVMFMSAHPTEELLARGQLGGEDEIVNKPFSREELAHAVRHLLDRPAPPASTSVGVTAGPPNAAASVLLVEDNRAARLALGDFLEDIGYRTLRAATGEQALTIALNAEEPIDVLLTDFSLPDMTGDAVARKIEELAPTIRVIYMSGRGRETLPVGAHDSFLQKPIDFDTLQHCLSDALGR